MPAVQSIYIIWSILNVIISDKRPFNTQYVGYKYILSYLFVLRITESIWLLKMQIKKRVYYESGLTSINDYFKPNPASYLWVNVYTPLIHYNNWQ